MTYPEPEMSDYELEQIKNSLKDLKVQLYNYLVDSYYSDPEGAIVAADKTFRYLANIVDLIIKKHSFKLQFGEGGAILWHAKIMEFLSLWLELEYKYSILLSEQLDALD